MLSRVGGYGKIAATVSPIFSPNGYPLAEDGYSSRVQSQIARPVQSVLLVYARKKRIESRGDGSNRWDCVLS